MKAIILAAGRAPRLLPRTKDVPQCLLQINGKGILEHQLDLLRAAGITDVMVVCGHMADRVEAACRDLGISAFSNPFYNAGGTAASLWVMRQQMNEDFLVLYSDILCDAEIFSSLTNDEAEICLAVKKDGVREEAEKVVEKHNRIQSVSKERKDGQNGEFIGVAKFSKSGGEKLSNAADVLLRSSLNVSVIDVFDFLIKKGQDIGVYDIGGSQCIDIDFPGDLKKTEDFLKKTQDRKSMEDKK